VIKHIEQKKKFLDSYHSELSRQVGEIANQTISHKEKAKQVNKVISNRHETLLSEIGDLDDTQEKQQSLLIAQYCTSVVSLEYRHRVWPYEYMALSRRVGELWERFCRSAWDSPSRLNVSRIEAPQFSTVGSALRKRLESALSVEDKAPALSDIEALFELVGDINMKEDEMFVIDQIPHIVDFKSGFGSNEKGNTLRLLTVGRAYKLWNPQTKLFLLVRQEQNNNYLEVLKRSGLWEVRCGDEAYDTIDEFTGSDFSKIRRHVVDFERDLSSDLWTELSSHLTDLTSYLEW